jgi:hypothetical protein
VKVNEVLPWLSVTGLPEAGEATEPAGPATEKFTGTPASGSLPGGPTGLLSSSSMAATVTGSPVCARDRPCRVRFGIGPVKNTVCVSVDTAPG